MRIKKTLLLTILSFSIGPIAHAFDIAPEVKALNQEFNNYQYPILIIDKADSESFLSSQNFEKLPENKQVDVLKNYFLRTFRMPLETNHAINLIPYFTVLKSSAVAMPFADNGKNKLCVVLPSDNKGDHLSEVQRLLGYDPSLDLYKKIDFQKLTKLLSLEDLRLISLYHELSHCLDPYYVVKFHNQDPDPHSIHQSESFAEVNALLMLSQRKGKRNLGTSRALFRGLYARHLGPFLAKQPPSMAGEAYNKGGAIYFLSFPILEAQSQIENFSRRVRDMNLQETLALSKEIVEFRAIKSRSFQALYMAFHEGEEKAHTYYLGLAQRDPDYFMIAYNDLLHSLTFLKNLDRLLPQ
ncbi:hypothetical protein BDW_07880 [Bdellovibrio bacteriovorus W]|nr:hypothetical protein BDW_07880 [Bdellovibrio bacteriovorus W]